MAARGPELDASGPLVLGSFTSISLTSSALAPATTFVFIDTVNRSTPTAFDGNLLVGTSSSVSLVVPPGELTVPLSMPATPALCNVVLFLQAVQIDPGASSGVSFSNGLGLHLGN